MARIRYVWIRAGIAMLVLMPVFMFLTFRAQGFDRAILNGTSGVRVDLTSADAITFAPRQASRGVLLIPGCPVDPVAYAPLANQIARHQLLVSIVRVPYRCAPLPQHEVELAARIARLTAGDIEHWVIAGHSRGAAHALRIAASRPARIRGLIIIGSTHPRDRDFSQLELPVMKIVGTEDGVAPLKASEENRRLLPASTRWVIIRGGNHAQFAHYAFQLWDHRARISREDQQAQTVAALVETVLGSHPWPQTVW